jgi:hypothetical protein
MSFPRQPSLRGRRHVPHCERLEDRALPSAASSYGDLPLSFEANVGQADAAVRYLAHGSGYALALTDSGAALSLAQAGAGGASALLQLQLVGANAAPAVVGLDQQAGHSNYLLGNDPSQWHTDVPLFGRVAYQQVYPGIDVVFYSNDQQQLEYDFDLAPGADPSQIALRFTGAQGQAVDGQGDLVLHLAGGDVVQQAPVVYQEVGGVRSPVAGAYVVRGDGSVGVALGGHDRTQALVVDPALTYATYLGGNASDRGQAIAVDANGNAYVTGTTSSNNFPTVNPLQAALHAGAPVADVFVAKLNAAGSALVYSTYLGGSGGDVGYGIAVDGLGNAYVTGSTDSTDFPTANPLQATNHGVFNPNAFVAKLNAAGNALVYSTYLGGSGGDVGYGIAVDGAGNAYVTGSAFSTDFPTANPLQASNHNAHGVGNAFVAKLNAAGSALVYATYLGGSGGSTGGMSPIFSGDTGNGIAVDGAGNAYVTGETNSTNFPTTAGAFQTALNGFGDAFVTKLNVAGNALVYSTYLGGSRFGGESGNGIAVDGAGNAYVTGLTTSTDFPTQNALQTQNRAGGSTAFVAKLNAAGSALVYSTYLGGSGGESGNGIAVDGAGNAYVTGDTGSTDFPTASPVQATNHNAHGVGNAFVAKLNAAGSALVYSTYLGGSGGDAGAGIAVDGFGNAYVTGTTRSTDFPTANPFQAAFGGGTEDAFVAKLPDIEPLVYTAPAGTGHQLLLGLDGPTVRLMDNGALVATRPLATTGAVLIYGADNEPDSLTIDNSAGLLALSGGVRFDGGAGGGNTVFLVGTPGGDTFTLTPTGFSLDGALTGSLFNVQSVTAFGGPGDAATLYDGPGNDLFVATPSYAYLQAGVSLSVASGFVAVQASSTAGSDLALLYDSTGSDVFVATPTYSSLSGSGFANTAIGFAQVRGNSSGGGDTANFYDSAGDDLFRGTPTYSFLAGNGFLNLAIGFANVNAFAGAGGSDFADLYDSPGDDTFTGQDSNGVLQGPGYRVGLGHFAVVRATSSAGGTDHLVLGAIDYTFQPLGNWQ